MSFYIVKPSHIVISLTYVGCLAFLPIIMFITGAFWYGVIFLIIWLFSFLGMLYQCLFRKIYISDCGVKYKTLFKSYEMTWDEIKIVGIGYIPIKAPGRKPWIYFSDQPVSIPMLSPRSFNKKFYMVSFRQKIIDEIKKHWDMGIDGFDFTTDFEVRMKKKI